MFSEEDLIPISALQHVMFCERQYALIHIEQLWEENLFTAEGRLLHERVDREHHEARRNLKVEYGMALRSMRHGLIGKTDLVEFTKDEKGGYLSIVPVEFKRGRKKLSDFDRVQLCAQALCLEEMFSVDVPEGQFYYLQEHRRTSTEFTEELRGRTLGAIERIRQINASGTVPEALYRKATCDRCSLFDLCMPRALNRGGKNVLRYIQNQIRINIEGSAT